MNKSDKDILEFILKKDLTRSPLFHQMLEADQPTEVFKWMIKNLDSPAAAIVLAQNKHLKAYLLESMHRKWRESMRTKRGWCCRRLRPTRGHQEKHWKP